MSASSDGLETIDPQHMPHRVSMRSGGLCNSAPAYLYQRTFSGRQDPIFGNETVPYPPTHTFDLPSKSTLGAVEPSLGFATVPESVARKSRDGTYRTQDTQSIYMILSIVYLAGGS